MFYVLDDENNKIEAYDKEEFLNVLAQAITDGTLNNIVADAAFVDQIRCCVGGETHKIAFITQAVYNQLRTNNQLLPNAYYFITDDTTEEDIDADLEALTERVTSLETRVNTIEPKTEHMGRNVTFVGYPPLSGSYSITERGLYAITAFDDTSANGLANISAVGTLMLSITDFSVDQTLWTQNYDLGVGTGTREIKYKSGTANSGLVWLKDTYTPTSGSTITKFFNQLNVKQIIKY